MPIPIVVVVRDPDYSNEFTMFGGEVTIHDMDLGRSNLNDIDEYLEWAEGHLHAADEFSNRYQGGVASKIRSVVESACPRELEEVLIAGNADVDDVDWTMIHEHIEANR